MVDYEAARFTNARFGLNAAYISRSDTILVNVLPKIRYDFGQDDAPNLIRLWAGMRQMSTTTYLGACPYLPKVAQLQHWKGSPLSYSSLEEESRHLFMGLVPLIVDKHITF